jgi:ribosomal protein S17E
MSLILLENHKNSFKADFDNNKQYLYDNNLIKSKRLRNEVAGDIARLLKQQNSSNSS